MKLPFSKNPGPESDEVWDDDFSDSPKSAPKPRAELILAILALLCAVVLVAVVAISLPVFHKSPAGKAPDPGADPELVLHSSHKEEEIELKDAPILEEETVPEVTTEPTIPPEANPYSQYDFQFNRDNYLICQKQDSYPGVDVSSFQGAIDWKKVADSGIRFAMIRLGYRGYGAAGIMKEDDYAKKNLEGATKAGLSIGAYFFSQAKNIAEVDQEIEYMLKILGKYEVQMPLVLDWEIVNAEGRTKYVDRRTLTDLLTHYCQVMTEKGYTPMVYFNWGQASRMLYLNELEDYPFWLALYQDRMTFPFRVEMWQYTCTGKVPGINGDVDINVYMPDLRAK